MSIGINYRLVFIRSFLQVCGVIYVKANFIVFFNQFSKLLKKKTITFKWSFHKNFND